MFHFTNDILPIVVMEGRQVVSYEGTGFMIAPRVLVTCYHCVRETLPPHQHYAAIIRVSEDDLRQYSLTSINRDGNGTDLASANIDWQPSTPLFPDAAEVRLSLAPGDIATGADVISFGYPATVNQRNVDGTVRVELGPQYLRTYITRVFDYDHPGYVRSPSYELGVAVQAGLSGAPLLSPANLKVVGLIYGNVDMYRIEEFVSVDPVTGKHEPEVRRVVSFGLAHSISSLDAMTGQAIGGLTLGEYCERHPW